MGKALALGLAIFVTVGAYYELSRQGSMLESEDRIAQNQYEVIAREGAMAGYNRAKQRLASNFADGEFTGTHAEADYAVLMDVTGDEANIRSLGTTTGGKRGEAEYEIRALYQREVGPLPSDPPAFMNFAFLVNQDLILEGNVTGDVMTVEGHDTSELNSNMHTNGNLTVNGSAALVSGFGTYVGSASFNGGSPLTTFQPNYNPTSSPHAYQASEVPIPAFDIPAFVAKITPDHSTSGNVTLAGDYSWGGTREDPYVWVVDGDIDVTGNTTINGYTMLIVNGDVDFNNRDFLAANSGWSGPMESSVAVYAAGGMEIRGNANVHAQLFSGGDFAFANGNPHVVGSMTILGNLTVGGSPTISYRPASPGLTTNWQERPTQVKLRSYHEK